MNFSSHQKNLVEKIQSALTQSKYNLVNEFVFILGSAKKLYNTDKFDFWLKTIDKTELSEIPMTVYSHSEAARSSKSLAENNKNQLIDTLDSICEALFTYSNESETCQLQSDYHFYYSIKDKCVFKESQLGMVEGIKTVAKNSYRIAYISDLSFNKVELYV